MKIISWYPLSSRRRSLLDGRSMMLIAVTQGF
jgi:hypothetical protein